MDSLIKRFETYMNATMPIVNFYDEKDLVKKVGAEKEPDQVFEDVKPLFA